MKLYFIRNATIRLTYAGHSILIDPSLAPKHTLPSFTGRSANPTVDLPLAPEAVIDGSELVMVSHLHADHFDSVAQMMLPTSIPILCQPGNESQIAEAGFQQATPVVEAMVWNGITIRRTPGRHGSSQAILGMMGMVSGFVFAAEGEPTIYWVGDSVWYEDIRAAIDQWQPDIIVTHSGGAVWGDDRELIIMDAAQTGAVCDYAPGSVVVAVHLEALDHCLTSRADVRDLARERGIGDDRLRIPADGAALEF